MATRFTVELERRQTDSLEDVVEQVVEAGASLVPGFEPVPMAGTPPTVCITVTVEDPAAEERIRNLPRLKQIWSDPEIDHFGAGRGRP